MECKHETKKDHLILDSKSCTHPGLEFLIGRDDGGNPCKYVRMCKFFEKRETFDDWLNKLPNTVINEAIKNETIIRFDLYKKEHGIKD